MAVLVAGKKNNKDIEVELSSAVRNFVINNSRDFLHARNITFTLLDEVSFQQCGHGTLLLTSSAVHGISTMASDIDMLCVINEPVSTEQMATQVHKDGLHFELLLFNDADVQSAFAELSRLAQSTALVSLQSYFDWDKHNKIPRKYLERLVYGVTSDLATPYLAALDDLRVVVARKDLDVFRVNVACSRLAQRSEEPLAAIGYLMNALTAAMNTLLSISGWVLSNKKWTLRRWNKSRDLAFLEICPSHRIEVSTLMADLSKGAAILDDVLSRVESLLHQLTQTLAPELLQDEGFIGLQGNTARHSLHGQAALVGAGKGFVRLAESLPTGITFAQSFAELSQLPRLSAREHLQAIRAGTWTPSLQNQSRLSGGEGAQHV